VLKRLLAIEDELRDILNDKNRAAIAESIENVRKLTDAIAKHSDDIEAILTNSASATKHLDDAAKTAQDVAKRVEGTMDRADAILNRTNKLVGSADRLVDNANAAVQENRPGVRNLTTRGVNQLERLLDNTNDLVIKISRVVDELERNPSRFLFGGRAQGYQPK
jgi:phospholipid/cholesterol/gamma-HCH transport system substrate-binding protein